METPNLNFICLPGDMQSAKDCFFTQNILNPKRIPIPEATLFINAHFYEIITGLLSGHSNL